MKRQGTQISLTKDRLSNLLDSSNQKNNYKFNSQAFTRIKYNYKKKLYYISKEEEKKRKIKIFEERRESDICDYNYQRKN